jgi:hypothetical protein
MSGRVVGGLGGVALASLLAGCSGAAMPVQTAEPTMVVNVRRTATEVVFDVPGWRRSGAQVYLCPRALQLDPDPERVRLLSTASHCLDLGVGPAGSGVEGIGMPFDSLSMADRATFDASKRWFVVMVESPTPVGRPPAMLQREVAGGPIAP